MTPTLKQKILERAAFNKEAFIDYCLDELGYIPSDITPAFPEWENARLLPVVTELLELVARQSEALKAMHHANYNTHCVWRDHVAPTHADKELINDAQVVANKALADTEATLIRLAEGRP